MSLSDVRDILKRIEEHLATVVDLDPQAEQAIQDLLNLVEHLIANQEALHQEVQRLKQQLANKKQTKTTNSADDDKPDTDHSSEKHRRKRQKPKPRPAGELIGIPIRGDGLNWPARGLVWMELRRMSNIWTA